MKALCAGISIVATLALAGPVGAVVKPKPWQWKTSQAAAKVTLAMNGAPQIFGTTGIYGPVTCRGLGKQTARRYVSFICSFMFDENGPAGITVGKKAWVKVRPAGKGGACISLVGLANVSRACLAARNLVTAPDTNPPEIAVRRATAARFGDQSGLWQSFTTLNCLGADGYYECSFKSMVSGTASVLYRASGAVVKFTALTCTDAYAGRPECNLSS